MEFSAESEIEGNDVGLEREEEKKSIILGEWRDTSVRGTQWHCPFH